jgi:hypothetical protein
MSYYNMKEQQDGEGVRASDMLRDAGVPVHCSAGIAGGGALTCESSLKVNMRTGC